MSMNSAGGFVRQHLHEVPVAHAAQADRFAVWSSAVEPVATVAGGGGERVGTGRARLTVGAVGAAAGRSVGRSGGAAMPKALVAGSWTSCCVDARAMHLHRREVAREAALHLGGGVARVELARRARRRPTTAGGASALRRSCESRRRDKRPERRLPRHPVAPAERVEQRGRRRAKLRRVGAALMRRRPRARVGPLDSYRTCRAAAVHISSVWHGRLKDLGRAMSDN